MESYYTKITEPYIKLNNGQKEYFKCCNPKCNDRSYIVDLYTCPECIPANICKFCLIIHKHNYDYDFMNQKEEEFFKLKEQLYIYNIKKPNTIESIKQRIKQSEKKVNEQKNKINNLINSNVSNLNFRECLHMDNYITQQKDELYNYERIKMDFDNELFRTEKFEKYLQIIEEKKKFPKYIKKCMVESKIILKDLICNDIIGLTMAYLE